MLVVACDITMLGARAWWLGRARNKHDVAKGERPSCGGWQIGVVVLVVLAAGWGLWRSQSVASDLQAALHLRPPESTWPYQGLALTLLVTVATVHISAMVDWAVIRLRLLGTLGDWTLTCQSGRDETSSNWILLTRLWLGHRLFAHLTVRAALVVGVAFVVAAIIDPDLSGSKPPESPGSTTEMIRNAYEPAAGASTPGRSVADAGSAAAPGPDAREAAKAAEHAVERLPADERQPSWVQPMATAAGAVTAAILVFFINQLLPSWSLLLTPRLSVGDRIVLAEEFGTGVDRRPVYFVVDISAEGAKLLQLGKGGEAKGSAGRDPRREHDRSLSLVDAPRLIRFRGRFTTCHDKCRKVQHDCPLEYGQAVGVRPDRRPQDVSDDAGAGIGEVAIAGPAELEEGVPRLNEVDSVDV
jgi:hypothetical protein